jgi:hypothetical protein
MGNFGGSFNMGSIRGQPNPMCRTSNTVSDVSGFAFASMIFRILPNCYIAYSNLGSLHIVICSSVPGP